VARNRMIRSTFWVDEKIGRLSYPERLTFIGLWTFADDNGVGRAHPAAMKGNIFPYDKISTVRFEKFLQHLAEEKLIYLYEVDKQRYYQVVNFLKHQKINRPTPSTLPMFAGRQKSPSTHGGLTDGSLPKERKEKEIKNQFNNKTIQYSPGRILDLSETELDSLIDLLGIMEADKAMKELSAYVQSHGNYLNNAYASVIAWAHGERDPYGMEEKE